MNRKTLFFLGYPVILFALLFLVHSHLAAYSRTAYREAEIIAEIRNKILSLYVEKVDPETLLEGALNGMVSTLDPYSAFLNVNRYRQVNDDIGGEFVGVGIEITVENGFLTVITPLEGAPAFHAGIMAGDKILAINGESAEGISINEAVERIRGPKGQAVILKVLHEGQKTPVDIKIVRDVIQLHSVRDGRLLTPQIGYIRITGFSQHTAQELRQKIKRLHEQGAQSLILDLRFNPGGLLDAAVGVCDLFLKQGKIVSIKGRKPEMTKEYWATSEGTLEYFGPGKLVILVNKASASASEIVAGALQDHHRAVIVGSRTYGKGSVQSIIPLKGDRMALKLTTARYYTPSGRSIQRTAKERGGLLPDVQIKLSAAERTQLIKWLRAHSIIRRPAKHPKIQLPQDRQLQAALEVLKGERLVPRSKQG